MPITSLETAGHAHEPGDVFEEELSAGSLQRDRVENPRFSCRMYSRVGELLFERAALHLCAVAKAAALVHELADVFFSEPRHIAPCS